MIMQRFKVPLLMKRRESTIADLAEHRDACIRDYARDEAKGKSKVFVLCLCVFRLLFGRGRAAWL